MLVKDSPEALKALTDVVFEEIYASRHLTFVSNHASLNGKNVYATYLELNPFIGLAYRDYVETHFASKRLSRTLPEFKVQVRLHCQITVPFAYYAQLALESPQVAKGETVWNTISASTINEFLGKLEQLPDVPPESD